MVRGLWFTAVALLGWSSMAHAQTAVLLPVGGDATLAAAHGAEATGHVERALEESSFTVLGGDALTSAITAAGAEPCSDPSCAGPMLGALHADLAVGLALWPRNGAVQVSVVLVDRAGVQVSADADGTESVIGTATESALAQARARWATRGGAPIVVAGAPVGAVIAVDGEPWGTLPHGGTLPPGTHHFVVSADGHESQRRDVEVASGTEPVTLTFDLRRTDTDAAAASTGPDAGLIGVGAASAAVGIGALIAGIVIASGAERCVRGCDGPAIDRVVSVPATELGAAIAIAGGVAIAAGLVLIIVGASPSSGPVTLTSNGLAVGF
jgi:hypothetical protein